MLCITGMILHTPLAPPLMTGRKTRDSRKGKRKGVAMNKFPSLKNLNANRGNSRALPKPQNDKKKGSVRSDKMSLSISKRPQGLQTHSGKCVEDTMDKGPQLSLNANHSTGLVESDGGHGYLTRSKVRLLSNNSSNHHVQPNQHVLTRTLRVLRSRSNWLELMGDNPKAY